MKQIKKNLTKVDRKIIKDTIFDVISKAESGNFAMYTHHSEYYNDLLDPEDHEQPLKVYTARQIMSVCRQLRKLGMLQTPTLKGKSDTQVFSIPDIMTIAKRKKTIYEKK